MKFQKITLFASIAIMCALTTTLLAQTQRPATPAAPARQPAAAAPTTRAAAPAAAPAAASDNTAASSLSNDPEIQQAVKEATEKFRASDIPGTLQIFKDLYAKRPEISPPHVNMAMLFLQSNAPQGAPLSLELATKETPDDPEAYLLLAELSLQQRGWTAAELLLNKADSLLPGYTVNAERKKNMVINSLRHRGQLADSREDWVLLQRCIDQIIKIRGDSAPLTRQLGYAYFQQKQDAKAKELFLKAEKMPDDQGLPADAVMSQLYLRRGDQDAAAKALRDALAANPESPEVLSLAITTRLNDNQLDEARALVENLSKLDKKLNPQQGESDNTKRLIGLVSLYRRDYATAERYFQDLVLKSPNDADATNGLALALCEQPDKAKIQRALEYAAANAQKHQNNREILSTFGWVCYKAERKQQALEVLKAASVGQQLTPNAALYLAKILVEEGQTDQAKNILAKVLESRQSFLMRVEAEELFKSLP